MRENTLKKTRDVLRAIARAVAEEAGQSAMRRTAKDVFDRFESIFVGGATEKQRAQAHARAATTSESCAALAGITSSIEMFKYLERHFEQRNTVGSAPAVGPAVDPGELGTQVARLRARVEGFGSAVDVHGAFSAAGIVGAECRGGGGVSATSALAPLFWVGREVVMKRNAFFEVIEEGGGTGGLDERGQPIVKSSRLRSMLSRRRAARLSATRAHKSFKLPDDGHVCFGRVLSHDASTAAAPFCIEFDNPLGANGSESKWALTASVRLALPHHAVVLLECAETITNARWVR